MRAVIYTHNIPDARHSAIFFVSIFVSFVGLSKVGQW